MDALAAAGALRGSHLIPSVRGELLSRLGRSAEARAELLTAAGQQHLRAVLLHYNALVLGQPEGYIQSTPGLFEEDGTVTDEGTAAFLRSIIEALVTLAKRTAPAEVPAV